MWLDAILYIAFLIVFIFELIFLFLPLSNERSTVRRLPLITFAILTINVIVYFICLPATVQQEKDQNKAFKDLNVYLEKNYQILADEKVRTKLRELGVYSSQLEVVEQELKSRPGLEAEYRSWLRGSEANRMRQEVDLKIARLKDALEAHIYSQYGVAPAGKWNPLQLITYAFLHGNNTLFGIIFPLHLFSNMIAFFAVAFSLEDLWGRSTFILFYLLSAVAAALPDAIAGTGLIGASGAVFATLGAFLVRLPKAKVKVGWFVAPPLTILPLVFGKKPFGVLKVPGYVFSPFMLISNLLFWWFINYKLGASGGVSYRCHITGFTFGVVFALFVKVTHFEEQYINPKIEAKVSFSGSPVVMQSLELVEKGELVRAESMLKSELAKKPDDLNTILALIQVHQHALNYNQLNEMYGRLIRHHLARHDKEAALYAYDNLLSSFPDNEIKILIPARDWLTICEYLCEAEMNREAGVEFERMVQAHTGDSLTLRACLQGGEASLLAHDNQRALRLFEMAEALNPPMAFASRVRAGIEKCRLRIENHPSWVKQPAKAQPLAEDVDEQNLQW